MPHDEADGRHEALSVSDVGEEPSHLRDRVEKESHLMNKTTNTTLVVIGTVIVVLLLVLVFGNRMMTGGMMNWWR